jgi:Xaa-Pro aminopeptidase
LGAQKALIAAVKPGIVPGKDRTTPNSLYKIASDYFDSHGRDLEGHPLGQYLTHGVSHHVGLDVHDPGAPDQPLEAGMVVTIEPGIYIPKEGLGIRIEDMVLVTVSGARLMSAALPREAEQIAKAMTR